MRELLIGVDGGGTKTNLVAVDIRTGEVVASAATGSIHLTAMGEKAALDNFRQGIAGLHLAGEDHVAAIAIGDPSVDDCDGKDASPVLSSAVAEWLENAKIFIKSDVFMAMYAFSGGAPGAFLIAGTGSMGIALTKPYRHGGENAFLTVGGWAVPTSDPSSGYDIAVRGIQAALNAFDGIAGPTRLCEALLEFAGVNSPRELIPWFNQGNRTRGEIARFALAVDRCAREGDGLAGDILDSAGRDLGRYAVRLMEDLPTPRIGVYGSVLLHNRRVGQAFEAHVQAAMPGATIHRPALPPEYGAVQFAADALGIDRRVWKWK